MADESITEEKKKYVDKNYFERNLKNFYKILNAKFKELSDKIQNAASGDDLTPKQKRQAVQASYPVGSYYMTETNMNPNQEFGGTWILEHESLKNQNPYWKPGWGDAAFLGGINVWRRVQ